jgi:THAP4-like, heme-binding beta-barrel domain
MRLSVALVSLCTIVNVVAADEKAADRWEPVRFLVGTWQGESRGEPGKGTVERSYSWTLGGKFIEEHNTSSYEPTAAGKAPEIHHHRGFLSYDKARKTVMLRHFHEEGFVNLYALNQSASTPTRVVFESVSFENFSNEWKARETYVILSPDEFIETFELAGPGKEFAVYSRNHFKRKT